MVLMIEVWPCTSGRVGMSFPRVENDALPVGAGWCENAIQQSEETPGMRAYDEEERTDRQGHATVEMPGPSQALRRRRRDERAGCSNTASRCAQAIRTRSDGMVFMAPAARGAEAMVGLVIAITLFQWRANPGTLVT